jgi:hypothetical protein
MDGATLVAVMAAKDVKPEDTRTAFASELGVDAALVLASPPALDPAQPLSLEVWWPPKAASPAKPPVDAGPAIDHSTITREKLRPDLKPNVPEFKSADAPTSYDWGGILNPKSKGV